MHTTDPDTGLPQLPEGHYWSVGPEAIVIMRAATDSEWATLGGTYYTQYFRGVEELDDGLKKQLDVVGRNAISNYSYYRHGEFRWVTKKVYYRHPILFWLYNRPGIKATLNVRAPKVVYSYIVKTDADNLKDHVIAAHYEWSLAQRSENIYGNYPPKSL